MPPPAPSCPHVPHLVVHPDAGMLCISSKALGGGPPHERGGAVAFREHIAAGIDDAAIHLGRERERHRMGVMWGGLMHVCACMWIHVAKRACMSVVGCTCMACTRMHACTWTNVCGLRM